MGVYEEVATEHPGMHWQQHDRYVGSAYDPSRDLSPNLPVHSCDSSSMGDVDQSLSNNSSFCSTTSSSNCSTPSNSNNNITSNNNNACSVHPCAHQRGYDVGPHIRPMAPCNNNCGGDSHCPRRAFDRSVPPSQTSSFPDCENSAFPSPLLHPKIEPNPSTPPSPQTSAEEAVVCDACGLRISDRFYLLAVDRRWHAACLQCCQCRQTLDGEATCFARDGNIYCKKDYFRLFGMKRCARCQAAISSTELVMRARDLVFHVHCFTCAVCNSVLTKGDHFGMRDSTVFCRFHYELTVSEPQPGEPSPASSSTTASSYPSGGYQPPYPSPDFSHHHHHHISSPLNLPHGSTNVPDVIANAKVSFFNGVTTGTVRQKGRPRKRKPKDLESMTASLDLNADYLDVPFGRGHGPGMPGSNGQQRTKRMRTSFKHHQLRTMKSYFAINHNPDAKDLKQLSQKTGLPKRVLQVWFQNARAKWRRMVLKQEGKSVPGDGKCSGPDSVGSLGDLDNYPHVPGGSLTGDYHTQSLGPHSPQFILSSSPPSSLEC